MQQLRICLLLYETKYIYLAQTNKYNTCYLNEYRSLRKRVTSQTVTSQLMVNARQFAKWPDTTWTHCENYLYQSFLKINFIRYDLFFHTEKYLQVSLEPWKEFQSLTFELWYVLSGFYRQKFARLFRIAWCSWSSSNLTLCKIVD